MFAKSLIFIAFFSIFLSGCGQSGALYLPDQDKHSSSANNDS